MDMISYMLYNMNFIARYYSFDPGLTNPTFFLGILLTSPIVLSPMFAINKNTLKFSMVSLIAIANSDGNNQDDLFISHGRCEEF